MPRHHVASELLVEYAAGALPEAEALVVATHLALCPACRAEVAGYEEVGGALLDRLEPAPVDADALDRLLGCLDESQPAAKPLPIPSRPPVLPEPLRSYLGCDLGQVAWRRLARGIEEYELPLADATGSRTVLLRVKSGRALPWHTHEGQELTLVLAGGFTDGDEHFRRGDVDWADPTVNHRPLADPGEDCICLATTHGRLRLTGLIGRMANLFIR
ncbi:MAG: cupin domain-containing protein [Proteobacteria bacterium]|nr:cupin domain-containing protein [Pseudomonadota bacterium]MBI3497789.1 cupin domain-containing protein [Pseudomonadota bacterium]